MIINKKWYSKIIKEAQSNNLSIFMFSIVGFIFGMYMISKYSSVSNIHEVFAICIGIAVTLKSVFYLLTPHVMQKLTKSMKPITKNMHYIGSIYLLV